MKKIIYPFLTLLLAACSASSANPAQRDEPFPTPGPSGTNPHVYPVETGWFEDKLVRYYNMGTNSPLDPSNPTQVLVDGVWVFTTGLNSDGSPIPLEGQNNILDFALGDAQYSDLWQAFFVTPAAGYVPNSITSLAALKASGMTIEKQPILVNCPFVPEGSSLTNSDLPLKKGWVNDKIFFYFDFGPTSATPGKLYAFVTGFNADGSPQLAPGQHFVFDSERASRDYSDFRLVHWVMVDGSYLADSIKSATDIDPAKVTASTIVVNYPQK
jgi:hypothetical protein